MENLPFQILLNQAIQEDDPEELYTIFEQSRVQKNGDGIRKVINNRSLGIAEELNLPNVTDFKSLMEEYDARNLFKLYNNPNNFKIFLRTLQESKGSRLADIFVNRFPDRSSISIKNLIVLLIHVLCFKATNNKKLEEVVLKILGNIRGSIYIPRVLEQIKDEHSFAVFTEIVMTKSISNSDLTLILKTIFKRYGIHNGLTFMLSNFTSHDVDNEILDRFLTAIRMDFINPWVLRFSDYISPKEVREQIPIVLNELDITSEKKREILTKLNIR
jgi:hypothetical protein